MLYLSSHRRTLGDVVPDAEYLAKYVDAGPYDGNHWFWRDGRRNHLHNERGQAAVRWKTRPCAASRYFSHGEFTVARLLIEQRDGAAPKYTRYVNVCGLSQCVNPDHWKREDRALAWRMEARADGVWQLVRLRTGVPAKKEVVVHVLHEGVVHVVAIAPLTSRHAFEPPRASCGHVVVPDVCLVVVDPVTCTGGC